MNQLRVTQSLTKYILWITTGVVIGTFALSYLRTAYYLELDIRPEMSPMMFVLMAPIVAVGFLLPALFVEILLALRWFQPQRWWQGVLIGIAYTFPMLSLFEYWMLLICAVINPVTLRLLYAPREFRRSIVALTFAGLFLVGVPWMVAEHYVLCSGPQLTQEFAVQIADRTLRRNGGKIPDGAEPKLISATVDTDLNWRISYKAGVCDVVVSVSRCGNAELGERTGKCA